MYTVPGRSRLLSIMPASSWLSLNSEITQWHNYDTFFTSLDVLLFILCVKWSNSSWNAKKNVSPFVRGVYNIYTPSYTMYTAVFGEWYLLAVLA